MEKDKKNIEFSIILPAYNVQNYIKKCIESILCQTIHDWELIMVDDGSTDQTAEIGQYYAAESDNITYIRQENQGMGPARNTGLQDARGSWVVFVDADDWIAPDFLEVLSKAQDTANADIVVCQYVRTFKDSENVDFNDRSYMTPEIYHRDDACFADIFQFDFMPWGKLFRKSLFDGNVEVFPSIAYEDYASMPYFFTQAQTICVIEDALYVWRNRSGSLTHQLGRFPDRIESMYCLARRFQEGGLFETFKEPLKKFFLKRIHVNERLHGDKLADFQQEFAREERDFFYHYYGEDFHAARLYTYGSYLSYVVGSTLKCRGMKGEYDDYYGFSSLIGLMNGGVSGWGEKPFASSNQFRKKAVVNELDTRFLKRTRTEFDDKDFVLLDFIEERYDLGMDGDGHYFTLSDAFLECNPYIEGGYLVLNRFSEEMDELWKESCDRFICWITGRIAPEKIILLRAKLAVCYGDGGKEQDYEDKEKILKINAYLDACYDYFEEHCPGIIVIDGLEQKNWYFTQGNFRHGRYPWHLNWYAYKQISNLTIEKLYF